MSLSPLEVENIQFSRSLFGGYDRTEVERFLAQVARSIDEYVNRVDQQQRQIQQLEAELQMHRENEDLLRSSVVHAQRSADELVAAARQRAETIKGEAALEADRLRHSLAELKNEREQFEFAFHGMLTGFIKRLEHNNPALGAPVAASAALIQREPSQEAGDETSAASQSQQPIASSPTVDAVPCPSYAALAPNQISGSNPAVDIDSDALDFEEALNRA